MFTRISASPRTSSRSARPRTPSRAVRPTPITSTPNGRSRSAIAVPIDPRPRMTTRRPRQLGRLDLVPLASRLRVARLHEAALHREDRSHDPLRERGVVDPPGVADHDVLGHMADEPVDAGAQRLDDAQPPRCPGEQLQERGAGPHERHDEVDLGEIRDRRGLGRDEPDVDVRRQLAHVDPLGDVRQADDERVGTGCRGLVCHLDRTIPGLGHDRVLPGSRHGSQSPQAGGSSRRPTVNQRQPSSPSRPPPHRAGASRHSSHGLARTTSWPKAPATGRGSRRFRTRSISSHSRRIRSAPSRGCSGSPASRCG